MPPPAVHSHPHRHPEVLRGHLRIHGDDAVKRQALIGAAKHLRLLLEEISELLSVRETDACKEVRSDLRPRVVLAWPKQRARTAEPPIFRSPTPIWVKDSIKSLFVPADESWSLQRKRTHRRDEALHLRRAATILSAAALTMMTIPANAHAAAIACGGGTSTGRVAINGCISAQRGSVGPFPSREMTAYIKARNTGTKGLNVSYEAFSRPDGGSWERVGTGRAYVRAGEAIGPVEVGSTTRVCAPVKVEIRVHARADGAAWSGWSSASTKQCQT